MEPDERRFRFLEQFRLSVTWSADGVSIFWRGRPVPGMPGAYHPITSGKTLEEATDRAIERWERKHDKPFRPENG
jgi:hypothetical protein